MESPCIFPAPEFAQMSLNKMARWLGIDKRELKKLYEAGRIPAPSVKPGRTGSETWTREEAAVVKWILDHAWTFTWHVPPK